MLEAQQAVRAGLVVLLEADPLVEVGRPVLSKNLKIDRQSKLSGTLNRLGKRSSAARSAQEEIPFGGVAGVGGDVRASDHPLRRSSASFRGI